VSNRSKQPTIWKGKHILPCLCSIPLYYYRPRVDLPPDPPKSQILSKTSSKNDDDIFMNDVVFFNTYHFESSRHFWISIGHQVALKLGRDSSAGKVLLFTVFLFLHVSINENPATCYLKRQKAERSWRLEMGKFAILSFFAYSLASVVWQLESCRRNFLFVLLLPALHVVTVFLFTYFDLLQPSFYPCCNLKHTPLWMIPFHVIVAIASKSAQ